MADGRPGPGEVGEPPRADDLIDARPFLGVLHGPCDGAGFLLQQLQAGIEVGLAAEGYLGRLECLHAGQALKLENGCFRAVGSWGNLWPGT